MENIKDYIRENYYYNHLTGNLWKKYESYCKVIGFLDHNYLRVYISGERFYVHRIAWFLYYGDFPKEQIDHIDQNKSNNKIENLREATKQQNMCNRGKQLNNTSGFKGVYFDRGDNKWIARITNNGKTHRLGYFNTAEEASSAYEKKSKELFGEFNPH